ncbi:MAG: hypothetical protein IKF22_04770 [Lachnospiraceae bacterium]|nr:hypothetical protein [Lachnospiraceae bacterium]
MKAVSFIEINSKRLKARKKAGSHPRSKRGMKTARMGKRAVDFMKITFEGVLTKI